MFGIRKLRYVFVLAMLIPQFAIAATGELWDVKMKMDGLGMDMPSNQVCMSKDKITEKDVKTDDSCHLTNFKSLGPNHVKFNFSCKDGSSGDADLQRDAKTFKQVMNMVTKGEKMTMKSEGKNTGQACDPEAGMKKAQAMMAQSCEEASKKFGGSAQGMFFPKKKSDYNCDKYKGAYCATVKSTVSNMGSDSKIYQQNAFNEGAPKEVIEIQGTWRDAVKSCGAGNPDSIQKSACSHAFNTSNWDMASTHCKVEYDALKAKECSGRTYTSVNQKYRDLCSGSLSEGGRNYTAESKTKKKSLFDKMPGMSGSSNENSAAPSGENPLEKAKKLKDVFGF